MKTSTKLLISCLFLGPLLFTSTWVILGFLNTGYTLFGTRIEPYSVIAQPISGLGLGNTALYMNAAFVISGFLMVLGSIGFSRALTGKAAAYKTRTAVLLSLVGFGTALCGIFHLDSFMLHMLGFLFALTPIVTFPYLGYKFRKNDKWRAVGNAMLSAGPVLLVLAIAYFASFSPEVSGRNEGYAGLTERVLLVVLFGYYAVLGVFAVGSKDQR